MAENDMEQDTAIGWIMDNRYANAYPDMRRHEGLVWELWGNALGGAWVSLEKPGYVWDTSWGDLEQDRDMIKTWLAWESGGKCSGQCLGRAGRGREGYQSISWSHCIDDMRNHEVDDDDDEDNEKRNWWWYLFLGDYGENVKLYYKSYRIDDSTIMYSCSKFN